MSERRKPTVEERMFQIKWDIRVVEGWMVIPGADLAALEADRSKLLARLEELEGRD